MNTAFLNCAAAACVLLTVTSASAADVFEVMTVGGDARTVAAELIDVNGDGRTDLLEIAYHGLPPDERRLARVYLQRDDGSLAAEPTFSHAIPPGAAAYDFADVDTAPGTELIILEERGLTVMQLGTPAGSVRQIRLEGASTVGAASDERGLKRIRIAHGEFADEPWLLIPRFGETVAVAADGRELAALEVGGRANYFVLTRPGPMFLESDIQLFYDVPRLSVGDVDGDGRVDVVASSRHQVRVFLRKADGTYPRQADRVLQLGRVSEEDHVRGSGAVRSEARDFDGDGRLDLIVSQLSGALTDGRATTSLYVNRGGTWNLDEADSTFTATSRWGGDELTDINGDGRLELVLVRVPLSVVELVEALLTRKFDVEISVHLLEPDGGYASSPAAKLKLDIPFSFDIGRPPGFSATTQHDLNADGYGDLVAPGDGEHIEIFLGRADTRYRKTDARQDVDTNGRLRAGDLDGDGLTDLVIYDPYRPGSRLRILRNRGVLAGSPARLESPDRDPRHD